MSASFANAFGSVTFTRAPLYPDGSNALLQATAESTGGEPVSRDPLGQIDTLNLKFAGMSKVDMTALDVFFTAAAKGMARTFTYTDVEAVAVTARFAVTALEISETSYERYSVTVPLFIE